MPFIPSFKPAITYPLLAKTVARLIRGMDGGALETFERRAALYLGTEDAVCVPSGRWALYFILKAMGFKKGDEVIIPAFTYFAVPAAVAALGLKPVYADIEKDSLNIDASSIEARITARTRAVIPTHLCGFPCDMDGVKAAIGARDIKIIEDSAQSIGSEYNGRKTGSLGLVSYFTFGATKHFTALGGGLAAIGDKELASKVRKGAEGLRPSGRPGAFILLLKSLIMKLVTSGPLFPSVSLTTRAFAEMNVDIIDLIFREKERALGREPEARGWTAAQAYLACRQLETLDSRCAARARAGEAIYSRLRYAEGIIVPRLNEKTKNIFSSCPVLAKDKRRIRYNLLKKGIDTSLGYMRDCSKPGIFGEGSKDCPMAGRAEDEVLYLPLYEGLNECGIEYITEILKEESRKV